MNDVNTTNDTIHLPAPSQEQQDRRHWRSFCHLGTCFTLSDRLIRTIFLLLGVGILIPWNAFVTAKPYLTSRLCQSGTSIIDFEQWFGLVWNLSALVSLGLMILGQSFSDYLKSGSQLSTPTNEGEISRNTNHSNTNRNFVHETGSQNVPNPSEIRATVEEEQPNSSLPRGNNRSRDSPQKSYFIVMISLGLYMMVFFIQALIVTIPDVAPTNFLIILFSGLALCGTCGAIATAGIVATAGHFPPHMGINPFFSGQALGGTLVAVANFAAIAIGEDPNEYVEEHCQSSMNHNNELRLNSHVSGLLVATKRRLKNKFDDSCSPYKNVDWAVLSYFSAGCFVLLLCLVGYQVIVRYQNTQNRHVYETVHDRHGDEDQIILDEESFSDEVDENSPRAGLELNDRLHQRQQNQSIDNLNNENQIQSNTVDTMRDGYIDPDDPKSMLPVIKGPATCVFLTFTITLCLFPSWISKLKSSHECENSYRLNNDLYVPSTFIVFNTGDLLGRLIAGHIPVNRIRHLSRKLLVCAMLRVLFLPLLFMCTSTLDGKSSTGIQNDFFSFLVQLLFAVSNGLLISTSFIWSPQLVGTNSIFQERASEIMTFSISFGLLSGSFLAFPVMRFASHVLN